MAVVAFAVAKSLDVAAAVFVAVAVVALVAVAVSWTVDVSLAPVTFVQNHLHSTIAGH